MRFRTNRTSVLINDIETISSLTQVQIKEKNQLLSSETIKIVHNKVYNHLIFKKNVLNNSRSNMEFKLCGKQTCFDDYRIILTQN